jgi:glycosyltransferase involved in cell wall biosynthesis
VVPRLLDDAPTDRARLPRGKQRPRVTVLNAYSVHPPNHGGRYRMHWMYRTLARHVDVDLVTLALEEEGSAVQWIAEGFREIRIARSAAHSKADLAAHAACGVAVYDVTALQHMALTPGYGEALARSLEHADAAILAHPYMTQALRDSGFAGPLVHESHNFEYALKQRMIPDNEAGRRLVELVHEAEGWCCRTAALVTATSEDDIRSLAGHYGVPTDKMMLIPNGTDTRSIAFADTAARKRLRRRIGLDGQGVALFLASGHRPNLEAAEHLFTLAQAMPDVAFAFVGNAIDAFTQRTLPGNVWRVGTVDEEARNVWLDVAGVALNPMLYGGGTNLKLLDYFAAGTPVVSTSIGIRGSDVQAGRHALIADVDAFEVPIREVLAGGERIERMAADARQLVEEQYDWWALGDRLHEGMAKCGLISG